jgi:hypothetical protein
VRCIDAHRRACQIVEAWHDTVFDPAAAAFREARSGVPHYTTASSYESNGGDIVRLTTANDMHVGLAMSFGRDARDHHEDDFARCRRELRNALDERNAKLQQLNDEWNATKLNERSDRLCDKRFEMFSAVCAYPVRTVADLALKLKTMQEHDEDEQPIGDLLADLRRIEGRA